MPSCTKVVVKYTGGMTEPVVGSKSWPARIARVEKPLSETFMGAGVLGAEEGEQVVASEHAGGFAVVHHEQRVDGAQRFPGCVDRLVDADEFQRRGDELLEGVGELRAARED